MAADNNLKPIQPIPPVEQHPASTGPVNMNQQNQQADPNSQMRNAINAQKNAGTKQQKIYMLCYKKILSYNKKYSNLFLKNFKKIALTS